MAWNCSNAQLIHWNCVLMLGLHDPESTKPLNPGILLIAAILRKFDGELKIIVNGHGPESTVALPHLPARADAGTSQRREP
jgi:hypothetical protein